VEPPWTPPPPPGSYPPPAQGSYPPPQPGSYPPQGYPSPFPPPPPRRGVSAGIIIAIVFAAFLAIGLLVAGSLWFMSGYEREQVELVNRSMERLAQGKPLAAADVCAEPDEMVAALMRNPDAWPFTEYKVLGIAEDNPIFPSELWHVDVRVDGELWIVKTWDRDAGRMWGICGLEQR
jgi:hypothetical protein